VFVELMKGILYAGIAAAFRTSPGVSSLVPATSTELAPSTGLNNSR
jgi:hypothetical protein